MNNVILLLTLAAQITINHLSNRRRSIYVIISSVPYSTLHPAELRTWKAHELDVLPIFLQRLNEHLALRCLACTV